MADIVDYVDGRLVGLSANEAEIVKINGLGTLEDACSSQLAFLANKKYRSQLPASKAGAVLIETESQQHLSKNQIGILVKDPYLAYAKVTKLFDWRLTNQAKVSSSACIADTACISSSAYIADGVVIADDCIVGDNVYIGPNSVIGERSIIGENTRIEANVTLYPDVKLGKRCLLHSAAVIGADGFGFAPSAEGWQKIHQLGGVWIGDDVEIGAGTTIDRGALQDTFVGDGVKLDNQVQIAHNVELGEKTAIAGCTAVAGSTKIGAESTIAGLSGITGHLELASGTHVTAMTLVSKSVSEPKQVISSGTGQESHQSWKKNVVRFKQLNEISKRLTDLEKKMKSFEKEG